MKNLLAKFVKSEEGSVVEYIIVLAVVAAILVLIFPGLKGKIQTWYNTMVNNVTTGIS